MKTLSDYPEYVKVHGAVEALRSEKTEVSSRLEQIALELSQPRQQQQVDGQAAWECALEGKDNDGIEDDTRAALREEQLRLEGRARRLDEALGFGEMELDRVVGRCSLEICQGIRKEWLRMFARSLS